MFGFGIGGPDQAGPLEGHLDRVMRGLAPWAVEGNRMVNFLSAGEATTAEQLRLVYGADRYRRLAEIKKTYDPLNMFRVNHNIVRRNHGGTAKPVESERRPLSGSISRSLEPGGLHSLRGP